MPWLELAFEMHCPSDSSNMRPQAVMLDLRKFIAPLKCLGVEMSYKVLHGIVYEERLAKKQFRPVCSEKCWRCQAS
eukprot:3521279-Prymnesium_polylepis.1